MTAIIITGECPHPSSPAAIPNFVIEKTGNMLGALTAKEIEEVLTGQYLGHLGCHANDVTYVVPISYVYDGDYIYSHAEEGKKIMMMRKNPKVCLQVEHMDDMANWKSVVAWGEYEELKDPAERHAALNKLLGRRLPYISSKTVQLSSQWPFAQEDTSNIKGIVYRIKLGKKTGRFEKGEETTYFR
jgi:nitroimidazol reductase NimA-like FMN-containing flavoprotein (pyridoxamine 5'-phosphate oxidase superfamily)